MRRPHSERAKAVRRLMTERGLSQKDLAEHFGVSQQTISLAFRNESKRLDEIERLLMKNAPLGIETTAGAEAASFDMQEVLNCAHDLITLCQAAPIPIRLELDLGEASLLVIKPKPASP